MKIEWEYVGEYGRVEDWTKVPIIKSGIFFLKRRKVSTNGSHQSCIVDSFSNNYFSNVLLELFFNILHKKAYISEIGSNYYS